MARERFSVTVEKWGHFVRQVSETGIEIPGTGTAKEDLEAMYRRAYELVRERDAHDAAKQAATRELQQILEKGRTVHHMLRQSLKVHLGDANEALTAYDIRPTRRRVRRSKGSSPEE